MSLNRLILAFFVGACSCGPRADDPLGGEGSPEATLLNITLSPSSARLVAGSTQQFTVSGQWGGGGSLVPTVSYSVSGGSIDGAGLFTAGATSGIYRVVARHATSGKADTSDVLVEISIPANTVLLKEDFEADLPADRGWYDNTAFTTSTAKHLPGSNRSLVWTWTAGQILPSFGGTARHPIAATNELYVSYWVKYSTNWVGSGQSFHPHEMYFLTTESGPWIGLSFTRLTTYIEHNYQTGGVPIIGTTDGENIDVSKIGVDLSATTESRSTAGCNGNTDGIATDCYALGAGLYNNGKWLKPAGNTPYFLASAGPGYKGDWHHVEVQFRMNTVNGGIGQANGTARYWFDGQLVIDRTNVLFRTGARPTTQWNQFVLGPYIGAGSPANQSAWVDNITIASVKP